MHILQNSLVDFLKDYWFISELFNKVFIDKEINICSDDLDKLFSSSVNFLKTSIADILVPSIFKTVKYIRLRMNKI